MRARGLALVALGLAAVPAAAQAPEPARYEGWSPSAAEGWAWEARPLPGPLAADTLQGPPDRWLGRDKALHAAGSFLLTLSAQYVLTAKGGAAEAEALPFSAGTALFLGVMKEVADSRHPRHPRFSWRDLAADAAGVLLAAGVIAL